jgi:hypothetical protein
MIDRFVVIVRHLWVCAVVVQTKQFLCISGVSCCSGFVELLLTGYMLNTQEVL